MKRRLIMCAAAVISGLLFAGTIYSQQVKIDAQIRTRSEIQRNKNQFNSVLFNNALSANSFSLLRSRVGFQFTGSDETVSGYLQFQDARTFGEELNIKDSSADALDLHQGYIKYNFEKETYLQIGRMELSFANGRFVGKSNWGNTGQAFDGILFKHATGRYEFSGFSATITEQSPYSNFDPDEYFSGIYAAYKNEERRKIHSFIFNNVNYDKLLSGPSENHKKLNRITTGFDYTENSNQFSYEIEGAYQFGYQALSSSYSSPRGDIRAYLLGLRATYSFPAIEKKPYINAGLDILSGDDNPADRKLTAVNLLYPDTHDFYGNMDYFTQFPAATFSRGLKDVFVGIGLSDIRSPLFKQKDYKGELTIYWHYFVTDKKDVKGNCYAGNEIDVNKTLSLDLLNVQYGFAFFFPGDIPKELPNNSKPGVWAYLMLTYNFKN